MELLKGIGVSPGIAISTAIVLDAEDLVIPRRLVASDELVQESERLKSAIDRAIAEIGDLRNDVTRLAGEEIGGVFDFHIGMLRDRSLTVQFQNEINHGVSAEYGVSVVMRKLANTFQQMPDPYFSERVKDIYDIEKRILRNLIGSRAQELSSLSQEVIVIAHDLLPSQTASLNKQFVKGFATDVGGRTSHTAIVARAMAIPAVVGLGNLSAVVGGGDNVIIDGSRGIVIVDPTADQIDEYCAMLDREKRVGIELATLNDLAATTLDGTQVSLQSNIEFPAEIDDALIRGAGGIGLYRTEFLYLGSATEPTEEDHFNAYVDALQRLDGRPLVIRTLDLGADKYDPKKVLLNPEPNPFLGDRSIRMCLHDIPMFKRQLRAILRASVEGDVRIMFPMISTLMELRQARMVLTDVMDELEDEGISFKRDLPIGMMVEVPAAALMATQFAREVAFFSIGTNDLIQYTLAVDRTNERVAGLFTAAHPSVLLLIRDIIRAGGRSNISVSVCGEMAGDPMYTILLLGMGLRVFSMSSPDIPEVKKIIRNTSIEHARSVARRVMSFDSERQVTHFLREETRKILPDIV